MCLCIDFFHLTFLWYLTLMLFYHLNLSHLCYHFQKIFSKYDSSKIPFTFGTIFQFHLTISYALLHRSFSFDISLIPYINIMSSSKDQSFALARSKVILEIRQLEIPSIFSDHSLFHLIILYVWLKRILDYLRLRGSNTQSQYLIHLEQHVYLFDAKLSLSAAQNEW